MATLRYLALLFVFSAAFFAGQSRAESETIYRPGFVCGQLGAAAGAGGNYLAKCTDPMNGQKYKVSLYFAPAVGLTGGVLAFDCFLKTPGPVKGVFAGFMGGLWLGPGLSYASIYHGTNGSCRISNIGVGLAVQLGFVRANVVPVE